MYMCRYVYVYVYVYIDISDTACRTWEARFEPCSEDADGMRGKQNNMK